MDPNTSTAATLNNLLAEIAPSPLTPTAGQKSFTVTTDTANCTTTDVVPASSLLKTSTRQDIPDRPFEQWSYDIDMFYIRPDNTKVDITPFINRFAYTMDFDLLVMGIFTIIFITPDEIANDIKKYFNDLKFFLNVNKFERTTPTTENNVYVKKYPVFINKELQIVDPQFLDVTVQEIKEDLKNAPRRRIQADFLSKKDNQMNFVVQSKVYQNVRVLDVIMSLLSDAAEKELKSGNPDSNEPFKTVVSLPDNTKVYEQIILDPGSVVENLYQLQQKYGVYQRGIRVFFNSANMQKDPITGNLIPTKLITVTDKSGVMPADNMITKISIEVIEVGDQNSYKTNSGSYFDESSETLICRTINAYKIEKRNSNKLIHGESIRVVGTSQTTHSYSTCDTVDAPYSMQKTYWNKNDNPYMLTEIQDSIKEKESSIYLKIDDVDILSFSNNLDYNIKFFNSDDQAYSGKYRLTNVRFEFSVVGMATKNNLIISGSYRFSNIPALTVDGTAQQPKTFEDKLAESATAADYTKVAFNDPKNPAVIQPDNVSATGPFNVSFPASIDNNSAAVPKQITDTYPMSKHIVFGDCYITKDGVDLKKANALCNDFHMFMSAQIFAKNILDPIIDRFGKFVGGGGRPNSFFRYSVPSGGSQTSAHLLALACDCALTSNVGDSLCDAFYWIAHNRDSLGIDQVILEGNGSQWRWIHIGLKINGVNRKEVKYSTGPNSGYQTVNTDLFNSPRQANFSLISSITN
jgi:hypothetical protein